MNSASSILRSACLAFALPAAAADIIWDQNASAGIQGGSGTWNTSGAGAPATNWTTNGGTTRAAWDNVNSADDTAVFNTGSGVVMLGEDIHLAGITFASTAKNTIGGRANMGYVLNNGPGKLQFGTQNALIDSTGTDSNGSQQIDNDLVGTGGLTIRATGTGTSSTGYGIILAGDNSNLTGGIQVDSGLVAVATPTGLGSNTLTLNGGGLFACVFRSGTGSTAVASPTTLQISNNIVLNAAGDNTFRVWGGRTFIADGQISGIGGLLKTDTGTTVLAGANSYGGTTTITNGILRVGNGGSSGVLGSGDVSITAAGASLQINRSNSHTIANNLSGVGSLNHMGSGTTTFSGNLTHTGTTTVSGGGMLVNGTLTGTSGITVNSGAFLGGSSGMITATGTITIQSGGSLRPGASLGALILNGANTSTTMLSLASGSQLNFELGAGLSSDQIALINSTAGDVAFANAVLHLADLTGGGLLQGQYTLFSADAAGAYAGLTTDGSGIITSGLSVGTGISGFNTSLQISGNNLVLNLTAVPEPAAAAFGSLALLALLRRRR